VDTGPFFYIYITIYCKHCLLFASIIYFTAKNTIFHTMRLILCYQQTSEIDNLTASWGKVFWLCCVQVPRFCWRQSHAPDLLWRRCQSQLATTFESDFFLLLVD
jgi:hypothetical protein